MESPYANNTTRSESPDSSIRAVNTNDAGGAEDVWMDEDDDDIDSRSSEHDDSDGLEFFDLLEETEPEYYGTDHVYLSFGVS